MKQELWSRIKRKQEIISGKRPFTEAELERIQDDFCAEFSHDSTSIEGNTLTLRETALVLKGITIDQKPLKEHLEIVGHGHGFQYICEIATSNVLISKQIIKEIHSLVLMDRPMDRGVFRRIPVRISGAYCIPSEPYLIEEHLEKLLNDFASNTTENVVEKLAWFHLVFEGIHPFVDGNGRTGRLLLSLQMMQNGFPPISIKYNDQKSYYDAFDSYYKEQNTQPMEYLIGKCLEERLDYFISLFE